MTVLPTILHLVTSLMRETCARDLAAPPVALVTACVEVLSTACGYRQKLVTEDCEKSTEESKSAQKDWDRLLQSTMASVLSYAHPGEYIVFFI